MYHVGVRVELRHLQATVLLLGGGTEAFLFFEPGLARKLALDPAGRISKAGANGFKRIPDGLDRGLTKVEHALDHLPHHLRQTRGDIGGGAEDDTDSKGEDEVDADGGQRAFDEVLATSEAYTYSKERDSERKECHLCVSTRVQDSNAERRSPVHVVSDQTHPQCTFCSVLHACLFSSLLFWFLPSSPSNSLNMTLPLSPPYTSAC